MSILQLCIVTLSRRNKNADSCRLWNEDLIWLLGLCRLTMSDSKENIYPKVFVLTPTCMIEHYSKDYQPFQQVHVITICVSTIRYSHSPNRDLSSLMLVWLQTRSFQVLVLEQKWPTSTEPTRSIYLTVWLKPSSMTFSNTPRLIFS